YLSFLSSEINVMSKAVSELGGQLSGDPFQTSSELSSLAGQIGSAGSGDVLVASHLSFLNRLDSLLTLRQVQLGDTADILQNVRWQRDLYIRASALGAVPS